MRGISTVTRRWALRAYPPVSMQRCRRYFSYPFLISRGQLNIASEERAGLTAVWTTRAEATLAKRQGVRRIVKKLEVVRVYVRVEVIEKTQQGAR